MDPRQTRMTLKESDGFNVPYEGSPTIKRLLEALYPFVIMADATAGLKDEQSFMQAAQLRAKHFRKAKEAYFSVVRTKLE